MDQLIVKIMVGILALNIFSLRVLAEEPFDVNDHQNGDYNHDRYDRGDGYHAAGGNQEPYCTIVIPGRYSVTRFNNSFSDFTKAKAISLCKKSGEAPSYCEYYASMSQSCSNK